MNADRRTQVGVARRRCVLALAAGLLLLARCSIPPVAVNYRSSAGAESAVPASVRLVVRPPVTSRVKLDTASLRRGVVQDLQATLFPNLVEHDEDLLVKADFDVLSVTGNGAAFLAFAAPGLGLLVWGQQDIANGITDANRTTALLKVAGGSVLVILGALLPINHYVCDFELRTDLVLPDGTNLKSYARTGRLSRWGNGFTKLDPLVSEAVKTAVESIRRQVIADRAEIVAAAGHQALPTPPTEEPKPVQPPPAPESDLQGHCADVDAGIPATGIVNNYAIAVVIGNHVYRDSIVPRVEYAERDAKTMRDYLIKEFGYRDDNIIFMENPTKADFEKTFGVRGNAKGRLYDYVKPNESDVFVYYVGHGAPGLKDNGAYFVPSDADPGYMELQGYPLDLFYENLSQIPAKSYTVVIDACFSGASEKGMLIQNASPIVVKTVEQTQKLQGKGIVLTSSAANEISSWYPEKQHSLFTYWLLKGLRGDADRDGNKEITLGELEDYLNDNVTYLARRLHGRDQHPRMEGDRATVVAKLK